MTELKPPLWRDGRFVVVVFLTICLLFAGFSVFVTLTGQWAPEPSAEPPPIRDLPDR